jgi:hypothetical protein
MSRVDTNESLTETFEYDDLNRVTQATVRRNVATGEGGNGRPVGPGALAGGISALAGCANNGFASVGSLVANAVLGGLRLLTPFSREGDFDS